MEEINHEQPPIEIDLDKAVKNEKDVNFVREMVLTISRNDYKLKNDDRFKQFINGFLKENCFFDGSSFCIVEDPHTSNYIRIFNSYTREVIIPKKGDFILSISIYPRLNYSIYTQNHLLYSFSYKAFFKEPLPIFLMSPLSMTINEETQGFELRIEYITSAEMKNSILSKGWKSYSFSNEIVIKEERVYNNGFHLREYKENE